MVKTTKNLNFHRKYYTKKKFKNFKKNPQLFNKISKKIKNPRTLMRKNTRRKNLSINRFKKTRTFKNNHAKKSIFNNIGKGITPQYIRDERNALLGISYIGIDGKEKITDAEIYADQLKQYYNDNLRNDILKWKKKKSQRPYYYSKDQTALLLEIPKYLPENNFLLYLKENYDNENIVGGEDVPSSGPIRENAETKKNGDGWVAANGVRSDNNKRVKLEKQAKLILDSPTLEDDDINKNFWIDQRMLGEYWKGLFDKVKSSDDFISIGDPPTPPM